jgi:hypothetical protein
LTSPRHPQVPGRIENVLTAADYVREILAHSLATWIVGALRAPSRDAGSRGFQTPGIRHSPWESAMQASAASQSCGASQIETMAARTPDAQSRSTVWRGHVGSASVGIPRVRPVGVSLPPSWNRADCGLLPDGEAREANRPAVPTQRRGVEADGDFLAANLALDRDRPTGHRCDAEWTTGSSPSARVEGACPVHPGM